MTQPTSADRPALFADAIRQSSGLFLAEGIILVILGILAILAPMIATLAATIFLGWLLIASGVLGLVTTFWARQAPGFWWSLLSAILALAAGVLLLASPVEGVLSLTFVLIAFFFLEGVLTIMYAVEHRRELTGRWGLMLASGIITLALGGMILAGLPATAAWALGVLVGIDLLFGGTALVAIALAARKAVPIAPHAA